MVSAEDAVIVTAIGLGLVLFVAILGRRRAKTALLAHPFSVENDGILLFLVFMSVFLATFLIDSIVLSIPWEVAFVTSSPLAVVLAGLSVGQRVWRRSHPR